MTAKTTNTYCRLCDGLCGLLADVDGSQLISLSADPDDPVSLGFICEAAHRSVDALGDPRRLTRPMKRVDGRLVEASWDEAISDISSRLKAIRSQSGARSVGVYLGAQVGRSSRTLARSLAFGVGMGTPHIFSEQCLAGGARSFVTELMLGHPTTLLTDLSRAHFVVLLGGDERQTHWGPLQAGMAHERWLRHSRRTKGTKVIVADPRRTGLAAEMDQHLAIRPGTETFLLLGMLSAIVRGGWGDSQYIRDYTRGYERLEELLAPWPVDRCAEVCGIDAAALSGVALKFSRAAMAVVHPSTGAFSNAHPLVGAWAWLALHTVTANTLRPGGLYDNRGAFDLHYALAAVPTEDAPRTRAGGFPLHLLQAPATALIDEAVTPGEGQVRALVCIEGNPRRTLPGGAKVGEALDALDLLVCLGTAVDETAEHADWVLPAAHPWEREDLHFLDNQLLPFVGSQRAPALVPPAGEARLQEDVLADLFKAVRPGLRGSSWGVHLSLLGQAAARTDLGAWEKKLLELLDEEGAQALSVPPYRYDKGESNRATWRIGHADQRIDLLPDAVAPLLRALEEPPRPTSLPLVLRTTGRRDRAPDLLHREAELADPGAFVHPDCGVADGARITVRTRSGSVVAVAHHDPELRPDVVDLPSGYAVDVLELCDPARVDPQTGTPELDGLACAVQPA